MISQNIYNQLIKSKNNKEIIVPTYKGQQGNPVLFSATLKKEIMSIEGDVGAKKILELYRKQSVSIETYDKYVLKDFNTKDNFNF